MSESEILDIVSAIETGDFSTALETIIKKPKEKAVRVFASVLDTLNLKVYEQSQELLELQNRLAAYEAAEDVEASSFVDGVIGSIVDDTSARKSCDLYDLHWFAGLEFSNLVKIQIAKRLVSTVNRYNPSFVPDLWKNVGSGDPQAIYAITFKRDPLTKEENKDED